MKTVNDQIVQLSQSSPKFRDLITTHSTKGKLGGKSSRKYYNFGLPKDGLHPGDRLSNFLYQNTIRLLSK